MTDFGFVRLIKEKNNKTSGLLEDLVFTFENNITIQKKDDAWVLSKGNTNIRLLPEKEDEKGENYYENAIPVYLMGCVGILGERGSIRIYGYNSHSDYWLNGADLSKNDFPPGFYKLTVSNSQNEKTFEYNGTTLTLTSTANSTGNMYTISSSKSKNNMKDVLKNNMFYNLIGIRIETTNDFPQLYFYVKDKFLRSFSCNSENNTCKMNERMQNAGMGMGSSRDDNFRRSTQKYKDEKGNMYTIFIRKNEHYIRRKNKKTGKFEYKKLKR